MELKELGLTSGQWLVANCGNYPSEKNCKVVLMAPESQRDDLVEAAAAHAIHAHGHQDTPELRSGLSGVIESITV